MLETKIPEEFSFAVITPKDASPVWREQLELVFVLQGSGKLYTEENELDHSIKEEDIFVINSYQMRSIILNNGARALSLLISPLFIKSVCPEIKNPIINCKSFLFSESRQDAFDLVRADFAHAFRAEYKKESPLPLHMRSKLAILLDHLFTHFLDKSQPTGKKSHGKEHLRAATEYIHHHYKENITLTHLAQHTFLSSSYISRMFQKNLGVTFTNYLTQVRIFHAISILQEENTTITEVSYESGFSSSSAFIEAFKQQYGTTPGQFRRSAQLLTTAAPDTLPQADEGFFTVFATLMKFRNKTIGDVTINTAAIAHELVANLANATQTLHHNWKYLINAGYAKDVLNGAVQKQLLQMQQEIGFKYIRCKGVLDDDMFLYTEDALGNVTYSFVYIDEVVDFLLSTGAEPFLELSYMPPALAKRKTVVFRRQTIISAPESLPKWRLLIETLLAHFVSRYGKKAMEKWIFSPWTSVEFSDMGMFTLQEYADIYTTSYRAIKAASSSFKVCSGGNVVHSTESNDWFIEMCVKENCVPDIISTRSFNSVHPNSENSPLQLTPSREAFYLAVSGDVDFLSSVYKKTRQTGKAFGLEKKPLLLDEWSNNIWQRDLCNDTSFKSAYIFKSILENQGQYAGMGYFNTSDRMDEIAPSADLFHGGFGLFLRNGIPKSAYRAMQLLSHMGNKLVFSKEGCFISASDDEIQIFLYNYTHYDMLYRYRHTTNLTKTSRYKVFEAKQPQAYHIQLKGLKSGEYKIQRFSIGPAGGGTYDEWLKMGAPSILCAAEEEELLRKSHPLYQTETLKCETSTTIDARLQTHEVQLITLKKMHTSKPSVYSCTHPKRGHKS